MTRATDSARLHENEMFQKIPHFGQGDALEKTFKDTNVKHSKRAKKRPGKKQSFKTKFKMGLSYEPLDHAEGFSSFYRLGSMYGILAYNYICDLRDKYG